MGSQNYVFTRTPEGALYSKDEKHAPREILEEIYNSIKWEEEGKFHLDFTTEKYISLLPSAIIIKEPTSDYSLNQYDSESIIRDALIDAISTRPMETLTFQKLKNSLNKKASLFYAKPQSRFRVITSIAIRDFKKSSIKINENTINFNIPSQVKSMFKSHDSSNYPMTDFIEKHRKSKFATMVIDSQTRTHQEAFDKAMQSADLLRALWTIISTKGSWKFTFGTPQPEPITVIPYGPAFFLYDQSKKSMSNLFWENRRHPTAPSFKLFNGHKKWSQIESIRNKATRAISKHSDKSQLTQILVRYINALDSLDHSTSFLHLWSVLESVTIPNTMQYDKLIERATRPFDQKSRPIVKGILKLIRTERNNLTHNSELTSDPTQLSYHLKLIIDIHLQILIFNTLKVDSIKEYAEILDLPVEISTLEKKRRMIQTMINREVYSRKT